MAERMICPACGAEMNFHAEKLLYREAGPELHSGFRECTEEIHTCPECGRTESRAASTV